MKKSLLIWMLLSCSLSFSQTVGSIMQEGVDAYGKGNYKEAIAAFTQCAAAAKKEGDKTVYAKALNNLANSLSQTGKTEEALKNYQLSLSVSVGINDHLNSAKTSKNIGTLYSEQKDFATALQHYSKALDYARLVKDDALIADCLNNTGVVYEQQEKFGEALDTYNAALAIYKGQGDESRIAMTLNNLAIVYRCLKKYPESIKKYDEALALSRKLDDTFMVSALLNNLGNVYALMGRHKESLRLCIEAYDTANSIDANEVIIEACDGISSAYENLGQYPEAIRYRKLYVQKKDSFINTERSAQLADMQVKYETAQKEAEIKLLTSDKKIQELQLERRSRLIWCLASLLVAVAFIAYFWKERQRFRNKLEKERLVRDTEEQERIRMAKDIHDDLGSGLTKINFLSEIIVQKTAGQPDVKSSSEAVQETAKKMVGNMRDLIWALNPENTTMANLIARMREYTSDYLEDFPAELRYDIPDNLPQEAITKESHRELLMMVKEILNNITKHSAATEVFFAVSQDNNRLSISIKDNGRGFSRSENGGNGLRNMESRLSNIGGSITIDSERGRGTEIKIAVPLKNMMRQ